MSMLDSLRESRAAAAAEAAELLAGDATAEALATVEARHAEIETLDAQIIKIEATEARSAEIAEARAAVKVPAFGGAQVGREPMTYGEHGERSYFRDLFNAQMRNDQGAWANLRRHTEELAVEARTTNGIDRVDGTGGEFSAPLWLLDLYAKTLRPSRVTADLVQKLALPSGTDSISIPRITTGALTGVQTSDNSATTQQDMVTTSVTRRFHSN